METSDDLPSQTSIHNYSVQFKKLICAYCKKCMDNFSTLCGVRFM